MNVAEAVVKKMIDDPIRARDRFWKLRHKLRQRKHVKDQLAQSRAMYGRASDKAQPTPVQAKLIALWKRQGKERRIIDYCDKEKIDPNRVLAGLKESSPTDAEILQSQLANEQNYLLTDRDRYLDCLNGKPLKDRKTPEEIRNGLILYWHIYRHIVDIKGPSQGR
jgi:hypothetical protein